MTEREDDKKENWGPGPWQEEPDRVEWRSQGFVCLALRGPMGAWCGYVGLPPGHPLHGKSGWGTGGENDDDRVSELNAHGGITYAAECAGHICHVPAPGEPDHVWWLGFDCSHAGDYSPGLNARLSRSGIRPWKPYVEPPLTVDSWLDRDERYRRLDYVKDECEQLATQLAAVVAPTS